MQVHVQQLFVQKDSVFENVRSWIQLHVGIKTFPIIGRVKMCVVERSQEVPLAGDLN